MLKKCNIFKHFEKKSFFANIYQSQFESHQVFENGRPPMYIHSLIDAVNPLTNSKRKEEAYANTSRLIYQKYQNSVAGVSVGLLIYFFTEYSAVHNTKNFLVS
jgi:hypothetical protein